MKTMEAFKLYLTVDCISFTILMVVYTVLSFFGITPAPDAKIIFILLGMTTANAVLMSFTNRITFKSTALHTLVDLLDIFVCVFGIGGVTGFIPFWQEPIYILIVGVMIVVIYIATYFVSILRLQVDVNSINRKIKRIQNDVKH